MIGNFFGRIICRDNRQLREQLKKTINKQIQLIIPACPPAGRRPNITGRLLEVYEDIIKMQLGEEHDSHTPEASQEPKIGIYHIDDIIGFVPATEGGCGERDPLADELQNLIGHRVELITSSQTEPITGVLLDVSAETVTLEVEEHDGSKRVVTLKLSEVTGYIDSGRPDPGNEPGKVVLAVTVQWPEGTDPREVDVSLIREDTETIIRTVDGVATFVTNPSGDIVIRGEDIPGFITPAKQIRLPGRQQYVTETLEYVAASVPVAGVGLDQENLQLLPGEEEQLIATVFPRNANNQEVSWASSNPAVATVNNQGGVTAISEGTAEITVTTAEGGFQDQATIQVVVIESVRNPSSITAVSNQVVLLPETVIVEVSNNTIMEVPVTWYDGSEQLGNTFVVPPNPAASYTLRGDVSGTNQDAELVIEVTAAPPGAVPVTGVSVMPNTATVYVGNTLQLIAEVSPADATTKAVIWYSSDESVATVSETGLVTALSPGLAVITVETVDGGHRAMTQLSIAPAPEIELIYPTQEVYTRPQDVVINVENLVTYKPIEAPTTYYVKVEQSGSNRILGEGEVVITPDTIEFNLYTATLFETTQNYSARYFVSMSTDPSFPPEEDLTLRTNFTIGTAVPSVPEDNIHVSLEMVGGRLDGNPEGITFILARELGDIPIEELTWEDYWDSDNQRYSDEVKLIGVTNSQGIVEWQVPRETLKLGGYVLLEETPAGYVDNLNLVNPESEDGSLIKEVRLSRNATIERNIINTPGD
ncbi:Ig-like domain-containing protein [Thalassobacillus devorans]|uniref:Ig-like domain-containing protein n=1 Tax=Thalassobacillus devorans TaxID=279813 RepID=UPI0004AF0DBF|nr:Ig-like domain-containing protein [Thalassobacillus devorans]